MTKKRQLSIVHRCLSGAGQLTWHGDTHPRRKLVEPLPALDGQKLMVCGRTNCPAKACRHPIDRLDTGSKRVQNRSWLQLPGFGIERENVEVPLSNQFVNSSVYACIRQVDERLAGQTSRLAQVTQHRNMRRPSLDRARELRERDHRHVQ